MNPHSFSTGFAGAVLVAALVVPSLAAAEGSEPITFRAAAMRTLAQHPQLRDWALQLQAAGARREQSQLRPALELETTVEGFAGSDEFRGVDGVELSVGLTSLFERGDKRAARLAVADATLGLLAADRQVVALDLLAETGRRFVDTARAGERLRIARLALAQTAATLALVKPRVASASSPRTELLDAEVRHSTARVAVANAERDLDAARLSLAAQWGDLKARPDTQFDLNNVPAMPPFESLLARLDNLPDLTRFASETQLRAAELRLARAQAVADWRWSLGVRRYEAEGEQALIAGFSVPLGVEKRAEPLAREAQVQLQRVDAQAAALRLRLQPLLYAQLQLLANTRARVASITDDELPRLQHAAKLTERGYRMGRFPYRDLAQAQQRIVEAEISLVDAAAEFHLTNIEVQRLVGAQLELLSESKL